MKVIGTGDSRVVVNSDDNSVYIFEAAEQSRLEIEELANLRQPSGNWSDFMLHYQGYDVFPFGPNNNLDNEIRDTLSNNHLAPRLQKKKKLLNWGLGPQLYRLEFKGESLVRNYEEDPEITRWLESWDYESYLEAQMTDFNYAEMCWTKVFNDRASRLSNTPRIARLEHVSVAKARYARKGGLPENNPPTHVMVGDFNRLDALAYKVYPITDWTKRQAVSMYQSKYYSFNTEHYPRPDTIGVLPWLRNSTSIPRILMYLSKNSLNVKFHVKSPKAYWDHQKEALEEKYTAEKKVLTQADWETFKDEKFRAIVKVLASEENVGKFFSSETVVTYEMGQAVTHEWEIVPIEQKIQDYVNSQIEISKHAQFAAIAGFGLHAALSNISGDGKSDSGSEQLYALQNYLLTETAMPEAKVTAAINKALAINFPGKKLKIGFYHNTPKREEDKTARDRIKNQNAN